MNAQQQQRYSRHLLLPGLGAAGQERLLAGSVLVVGAGGLGSPLALYLAAAGVGCLGLADGDAVALSNLQRQVAHFTADIGRPKALSAAEKAQNINPDCEVKVHGAFIDDATVDGIVAGYDLVVEATDNAASRYRINDACTRAGKPFIIGGISGFEGQAMTCLPGTATYRDVFPESPRCSDTGTPETTENAELGALPVFGPAVGMLGTIMAAEAVKVLAGVGEPLTNRLLTFNALTMDFDIFKI